MLLSILLALFSLTLAGPVQALTPDELRAKIDSETSSTDPFVEMLNDPDPARSLAAVQLMIESEDPRLRQIAVDFGLQSAVPEVRRAAIMGFLQTKPLLQIQLTVPEESLVDFEKEFRGATSGSVLPNGSAIYSVNVGQFNAEKNCFLLTGLDICAVEVGPTGLKIISVGRFDDTAVSNLVWTPEGTLAGSTSIDDFSGGIPSTLVVAD